MALTSINTGTTGVQLTFTQIDNMVSVDLNPDGQQGNGNLGWSRVMESNSAGFGLYGGNITITLDQYLQAYQSNGATSVNLAIVASNWSGPGSIVGTLTYSGGSTPINFSLAEWTSQQQAFTLVF